jgi:uncharacterized protein (DUF58 family)
MLLATDRLEKVVPPRKGRRHVLRLVREVLGYAPDGFGTDLAQGLDHLRHVLHHRSVVFIISDFLTEGFEQALAVAARRHDVIAIAVEDPMEQNLPEAGLIQVIDCETGRTMAIDTSNRLLRRKFAEDAARRRGERQALCRRHEVDLIELSTDQPYDAELVKFFKRRTRRLFH